MRPGRGERGTGRGQRTLDTGVVALVTDDPTNDVVNPITAPMRANDLKEVLFDIWLMGRTKLQVRIGVEFSNNPVDFVNGVVARKELTAYGTGQNWSYGNTWYDVFNISGLTDPDYKLYLRFVALAKTLSSSTRAEGAQLRVLVHQKPLQSRTLASPMVRVNTKGLTGVGNGNYCPLTDPLPAADVAFHRATVEVMANTGCILTVGWQQSDTPDDVTSWVFGGAISTDVLAGTQSAVVYPGKPVAVAPTKRFIRYAVYCTNGAGTEIESALVRVTVDLRDR